MPKFVADSVEATGLKWAAPAGGGKVLQVISATILTAATNSTNTYADSGLTASITPSVNTSKVLIMTSQQYAKTNGNANNAVDTRLMRGASEIARISKDTGYTGSAIWNIGTISYCYLDSPSTTSSTTYKVQFRNDSANAAVAVSNNGVELQSMILMEIGA